MPIRRILLWTALASAGLLVAVGVTTAATTLTSQRVGLQAEPLDAGEALAPAPRRTATLKPTATPKPERTPTATPDPEPADDNSGSSGSGSDDARPVEPGDDSGGHGGGGDD